MTQEELGALHAALETVLAWPDVVRAEVARWLTAPEAAKPNGRDRHPPPLASTPRAAQPRPAAPRGPPTSAERRLLAAMQEHSGASVNVLAKAAGANRSSAGDRLRGLASRGVVMKDSAGHWRLVAELAGEAAGPTQPPSS